MSGRTERWRKRKGILLKRLREHGLPLNPRRTSNPEKVPEPRLVLVSSQNSESVEENIPEINNPEDDNPMCNLYANSQEVMDDNASLYSEIPEKPNEASPSNSENFKEQVKKNAHSILERKNQIALKVARIASIHNINDKCVSDILKLLCDSKHDTEKPPATFHEYEKHLQLKKYTATFFWICDSCNNVSETSVFKTPYSKYCCGKKLDERLDHFILMDLKEQVVLAINGTSTKQNLTNEKHKLLVDNYGATKDDIMITLNTDGAPLFSSSNSSLWPILGFIDDLPNAMQKTRLMLLGLWISKGPKKPKFDLFLGKFVDRIKNLHKEYVIWMDSNGTPRKSHIFISRVMCDSIARPAVQMMNQFNAKYGCGYCYHNEGGHYYSHFDILLRSHEEHKDICEQLNSPSSTFGVLSKSPFMKLEYIDMIKDFPVDVLHVVYLGVVEHFTSKWFCPSSKGLRYYISPEQLKQIDFILLSIKPPRRVSRLTRSLLYRGAFKGHEWNMWLTYYSPVILEQFLPREYYDHWLLLVNGVSLLNYRVKELTASNIQRGSKLLNDFCLNVERLYGRQSCRFNVHLLRHFELVVKRFGPLHLYSMTIFESYNATLKSYVKSSFGVGLQIIKRFLRDSVSREATKITDNDYKKVKLSRNSVGNYLVGLEQFSDTYDSQYFKSIYFRTRIYSSKASSKGQRRCSYMFWTINLTVLEVYFYFEKDNELFAYGKEYDLKQSECQVDHIYEVESSQLTFLKFHDLVNNCIQIVNQKMYFLKFINDAECNCE